MARSSAARKYQLTINNPQSNGLSHDVIRHSISDFSGCVYWCLCDEIGESGTLHTHVFLAFRNPVEFTNMKRHFYEAHIEPAKGSYRENRDYIRKEGRYLNDPKHETNLPETFEENGELPEEAPAKQKQSEAILAMLDEGASNEEIIRCFPSWMKNLRSLDEMRQTLAEEKQKNCFRTLDVRYLWGKTGVGKTRYVMEKYGYSNVYRVTNYEHPFDGYNGEPVILFDEFRSSLPITDMLKYLDGYPLRLPCRFRDRVALFTVVYLISNIPLEDQYPNVQLSEPETWRAFCRRISDVSEKLDAEQIAELPFSGGAANV